MKSNWSGCICGVYIPVVCKFCTLVLQTCTGHIQNGDLIQSPRHLAEACHQSGHQRLASSMHEASFWEPCSWAGVAGISWPSYWFLLSWPASALPWPWGISWKHTWNRGSFWDAPFSQYGNHELKPSDQLAQLASHHHCQIHQGPRSREMVERICLCPNN